MIVHTSLSTVVLDGHVTRKSISSEKCTVPVSDTMYAFASKSSNTYISDIVKYVKSVYAKSSVLLLCMLLYSHGLL